MSYTRFTNKHLNSFTPPPLKEMGRLLALRRHYFAPYFEGIDRIDASRPALFVGNHAIFGAIDAPLFVYELYRRKGIFPRSLGDHFHFGIPVWGSTLERYGAVPGTPDICRTLMQQKQFIMVFPGGAREVAKRRGEQHKLFWKKRAGFARLAIENGYDILPFSSVGCDVSVDILYDGNDFSNSWLGKRLLANSRFNKLTRDGDLFWPLVRGVGPTSIPRPQPFWFKVGERISTEQLQGQENNKDVVWQLREQVADNINSMISDLSARREQSLANLPRWRRWLI